MKSRSRPLSTRSARAARAARRRRLRWQRRYRPLNIELLLVAEAPPSALDRYFYFPDVGSQDSLFRYVTRSVLGLEPDRAGKRQILSLLRAHGVYLVDAQPEPLARSFDPDLSALVRTVRRLAPTHIILIKATVYDRCHSALVDAGLPVVDVRVPFPGSGQQRRFESAMAKALRGAGWKRPSLRSQHASDVYISPGRPEPEIPGGCQVVALSTRELCRNPGRHEIDGVVTCTTHRKAIERARYA